MSLLIYIWYNAFVKNDDKYKVIFYAIEVTILLNYVFKSLTNLKNPDICCDELAS